MFRNMKENKFYLIFLFLLVSVSLVKATDIPLITTPITVNSGNSVQYNFNPLSQGQYIRVYIKSRFPNPTLSGSSYGVYIEINGKPVNAGVSRTVGRRLTYPLVSPVTPTISAPWWHPELGWRALYAPDYNTIESFYTCYPYSFHLDISDLINETNGNVITVTNKHPYATMEIAELKITTYNYGSVSPTIAAAESMVPYFSSGEPAAGPATYTYSILAGGGFTITVKNKTWEFSSDFSYPDSGYNKLVPLSTQDTSGETSWTVSKNGNTITASGSNYSITRNFQFEDEKITVTDEITNTGSSGLAMIIDHHVDVSGMTNPLVTMAGNPDPNISISGSSSNPSIHIAASDHGIGMLWDNDVSRVHGGGMYFSPEPSAVPPTTCTAGLMDEMLYIPVNSTHTNIWSIYPVNSKYYYDFVNMVRQEWGANFTVDGAYCWFDANDILNYTVNEVAESLNFNGIKYAFVTGGLRDTEASIVRIGFGVAIADNYWSNYRTAIRSAAALIRQAKPDVKVGIYYNSRRDSSEVSYTIDNKITLNDGSISYINWGLGEEIITTNMIATDINDFGADLLNLIDDCIMAPVSGGDPALGLDGIYWDEAGGTYPLVTYNYSDGISCIIDTDDFTVSRQYAVCASVSKQHDLNTVGAIKDNYGFALANGASFSKGMLATHMPRFVEVLHVNKPYAYKTHLGTPLGYMVNGGTFAHMITVLERGCVPIWGFWSSTTYPIYKYFWPLTVMELHSGYVLAQERIIATHTGSYGWRAGNSMVQIRHFNSSGELQGTTSYPTNIPGSTTNVSALADGEAIIIERLPATIDPRP